MDQAKEFTFADIIYDPLPGREPKPRTVGQTMLIDKGLGLTQTGDLMELAADYVDFFKFTCGTAALHPAPLLRAKVALIRSYGVDVYPGGTFFEVALIQGQLEAYLKRAQEFGFNYIEVSDGTITLSQADRRDAIRRIREHGFAVISEVGKKADGAILEPLAALEQIEADLEAGAVKVILEGRESGKGVGFYDAQGRLNQEDLEQMAAGLKDNSAVIWEAPLKSQQEALICQFGPNVNLGNIPPGEILALECLRLGLRGDTLRLALSSRAAAPTAQPQIWR